jgi:ribosomal protein S18
LTPNGKILSRKRTGFGGQNQRRLAVAIKNARFLGLMPFIGRS